jgi:hypothetical protein
MYLISVHIILHTPVVMSLFYLLIHESVIRILNIVMLDKFNPVPISAFGIALHRSIYKYIFTYSPSHNQIPALDAVYYKIVNKVLL